ncbi:MAG: thioredoxin family protein [Polyangiales bacterium]
MRFACALLLSCSTLACSSRSEPPVATETKQTEQASAAPEPVPSTPAASAPSAAAHGPLPFITDDYPRALAEARRRGQPLFVDVWASWCHTCLSLQQYVLPDPQLVQRKDAFVWLAIDSERASNAAFLKQFPSRFLPTLWVIDPASEKPLLKWLGAATAAELVSVLDEATKPAARGDGDNAAAPGGAAQATAAWLRGNRASASGDTEGAIALYREALQSAPPGWSERARTAEALSMRYTETHAHDATYALAVQEAEALPPSTARLNVVVNGVDAAAELAKAGKAPKPDELARLLTLGTRIAQAENDPVLLDDRSTLYLSLVTTFSKNEPERAQTLARTWVTQLEAAAAKASDSAARRVWDAHRVEAYLALKEPAKAVSMLEQSEREAPDDYNPPARLARAQLALGQHAAAKDAITRALARCEGPRKLRLYVLQSEIAVAQGDRPAARNALQDALRYAEATALAPQYDALRKNIEQKLAELS